jgi:catechol 2,3-dioxygenase-like lactoylglutathione lyase family enzyme
MSKVLVPLIFAALALSALRSSPPSSEADEARQDGLSLGAFSVSLAVKDLEKSRDFYEKLGFETVLGQAAQNFLILRNADQITIGLFHGMFKDNIMTFNPGWSPTAENLQDFTDIRVIQKQLKEAGLELETEADLQSTGPANLTLLDPDGNRILLDQHR